MFPMKPKMETEMEPEMSGGSDSLVKALEQAQAALEQAIVAATMKRREAPTEEPEKPAMEVEVKPEDEIEGA